ncbi:MAG TPA: RdgB/HAM1 family non-canonical purine NTP pyrophosphatase [Thermopetrobacter sp.]|nr:RdgB/HAM1 family non-canonical purine NTP pyrophosphatase [Thermopetrobacter sp.]
MRPLATGETIVIASHNPGKVREIAALLEPLGFSVVSAGELGLPEPVEDGATFTDNALIKARAAASASGRVALADDSGLCVAALDGAPGIHSARWGGPEKDFARAMRLVEEELQAKGAVTPEQRRAHFACALALAWPDGAAETFTGEVHGRLVWPPRGEKGFGYDPVFVPDGHDITFGEMEPEKKHAMSHRARAFAKLLDALRAAKDGS